MTTRCASVLSPELDQIGHPATQTSLLEAFIREVQALVRAGDLDAGAGARLIAEAQARIDALRAV
jgi:hypothetical protein